MGARKAGLTPRQATAVHWKRSINDNRAMAIPQGFIDELLNRVDVVEVVGRHVQLKRAGANYQGLCPFHGEKSPSFTVSPSKQFYHCFGCGKNGNAIGFLMDHTGSGFVETVQDLAQQSGLVVPQEQISPQDMARQQAQRETRKTLSDLLAQAGQAYSERLKSTQLAIDYLKKRGLSGEIVNRFGLGYAADTWRGLASVFAAYDDPLLEQCGLIIHNEQEDKRYDRFRGRVMFPIRNERGECIGFGGRVLGDEKPKYLNSPETPVFSKGHELYGLFEGRNAIRDAGFALVTEGYMDVVALAQLGLPNAVATLGTACTPEHMTKLFRVTDQVVFSFDGDGAGRRAAQKALRVALPLATDVRAIKFLFLPAEHDPDSFVRAHGKAAFEQAIKVATPLSRFLIEVAGDNLDLETAEGRAKTAARSAELWQLLPQGALAQQVLTDIAAQVRLDVQQLLASWRATGALPNANRAPQRLDARTEPRWAQGNDSGSMQALPHNIERQQHDTPQNSATHSPAADGFDAFAGYAEAGFTGFEPADFPSAGGPADWPMPRAQAPSYGGGKFSKGFDRNARGKYRGGHADKRWPDTPRPMGTPTSRAEHAARLLLSQMSLWEQLSEADHTLLCAQPAPIGPLITWLDALFQDQGAMAWGMLSEQIRTQSFAQFALDLMARHQALSAPQSATEIAGELRSIMLGISHDAYADLATRAARANDVDGLRRANDAIKRISVERAAMRTDD